MLMNIFTFSLIYTQGSIRKEQGGKSQKICNKICNKNSENCEICNKSNIGLYRDGGLSIFRTKSGTQLEKIKKKFAKII